MKLSAGKVAGAVLVVAVGALFTVRIQDSLAKNRQAEGQQVAAPVTVTTTTPTRRTMTRSSKLTGVVRPHNEVDVFVRLPARVERVHVKVGDEVKAGQPLADLEARDTALQLKQAEAQLMSARASLEKARADTRLAEQTAERMRNLRKENAVPLAELERAESGMLAASTGARMGQAQVAVAESAVALAREQLGQRRVISPIAGTVTKRSVNIGTQASPQVPAFQVQDVSALKLEGMVDAADFVKLEVGQTVDVRVDALPDAVFSGAISTLSPTLDPQTRRAAVEISIDNKGGRLLANMLGSAEIKLGQVEGVLTVPLAAVVNLPGGRGIYVARDGKAVALQSGAGQLELGAEEGGFVEVKSGLAETDHVIVSDQGGLTNGAPLKIARATPTSEAP